MSSGATLSSRSTRVSDSLASTSTRSASSTMGRTSSMRRFCSRSTTGRLEDAGDLDQVPDLVGGLRALADPVVRLLLVYFYRLGLGLRLVGADPLYKRAVARAVGVGDDDPVERVTLRAVPREPYLYSHALSSQTL